MDVNRSSTLPQAGHIRHPGYNKSAPYTAVNHHYLTGPTRCLSCYRVILVFC